MNISTCIQVEGVTSLHNPANNERLSLPLLPKPPVDHVLLKTKNKLVDHVQGLGELARDRNS